MDRILKGGLVTAASVLLAGAANAMSCADTMTAGQHPAGLTITEAVETAPTDDIPVAHCLVRGATEKRQGADGKSYAIRFELRLPVAWNGRMVHQFNGGNDGVVVPALGPYLGGNKKQNALSNGYAVISSDAGHDGSANPDKGLAGAAAFGFDPQARIDYGYGAVAKLQPLAKAMIAQFYGKPVQYVYGVGSSNGGRHALVAATRMPDAFDGLLAGYPGFNLPKAAVQHAWDFQAWRSVNSDVAKAFSRADMSVLAKGILAACDQLDGVRDGLVSDSAACEAAFKPESLECKGDAKEGCLSKPQIAALVKSHSGPHNSKGEQLYSRWAWDPGMASNNWRGWKLESQVEAWGKKPIIGVMGAASLAQVFSTPPTPVGGSPADLENFLITYDFDKDAPKIFATDAIFKQSAVDVMLPPDTAKPELKAFRDAGHKMIVFHGNADPVFSVLDTVKWYEALNANNGGKAADFARFYRIPGMPHGAGGPSFDDFDFFTPLVAWVEQGKVPQSIVAGITPTNKEAGDLVGKKTVYCPYPQVAKASGKADAQDDARYSCQ